MKKLTAHDIALSALAAALATIFMTLGIYFDLFLFTAYLFACIALMLPLSRKCYWGYALAYIAACGLTLIFGAVSRFWDLLPFIMFFGLHPLVNELQLKIKINRWIACGIKAVWFDGTMYVIWRFIFGMTTSVPWLDKYMLPIFIVVGSGFFIFYDYAMYKWRAAVNLLVKRISKK